MNARRASRELALLTLFQLEKQGNIALGQTVDQLDLQTLILTAVRTLSDEARTMVMDSAKDLALVSQSILALELEHPDNLNTSMEAAIQPVPLPNTRETAEKIDKCLLAAEYVAEALRLPELLALSGSDAVREYAIRLVKAVHTHQEEIDSLINDASDEWRMDRLIKMDAAILRLAVAEMKYMPEVDFGVSIDEAVELAQEFSTEESFRLINGILGKLADQLAENTDADAAGNLAGKASPHV